jgi:hypothetical protein
LRKGDAVFIGGERFTVISSSEDETPLQRLKGKIRFVRFMQRIGFPMVVPEHAALAERLRPRDHHKSA